MYETHPMFTPPNDENQKIWRYTNLTKFLSLLDKRALFFASPNSFEDPYESLLPKKDMLRALNRGAFSGIGNELQRMAAIQNEIRDAHKQNFANCWYSSDYESAAMWRQYSSYNDGIAIQSTFARLRDSFGTLPDNFDLDIPPVFIGIVHYINYDTESTYDTIVDPRLNTLRWLLHKRLSFQSEQELRAITDASGDDGSVARGGRYVLVNLKVLIENIYLSPAAQPWQVELVESLVRKYGIEAPVLQSNMWQNPPY